jgi:hypothetical protein
MSMADGDTLHARAAVRDQTLHTLVDVLNADDRIVAAWLGGSISQGAGDALSDLDLTVVVTAAASAALCARPWQLAGRIYAVDGSRPYSLPDHGTSRSVRAGVHGR